MIPAQPEKDIQFNERQALKNLVLKGVIAQEEIEAYLGNVPTTPDLSIAFHITAGIVADNVATKATAYATAVKAPVTSGERLSDDSEAIRYWTLVASRLYDRAQELQEHEAGGRLGYLGKQTSTLEEALEMWIRIEREEKIPFLSSPKQLSFAHDYRDNLILEWREVFDRLPNRPAGSPITPREIVPKAA